MKRRKAERRRRKQIAASTGHGADVSDSTDSEELEEVDMELEFNEVDEVCPICEREYKEPVLTICGHVFCESCAINHYKNEKTCFKCDKATNGVFNNGQDLVEKARAERKIYKKKLEG